MRISHNELLKSKNYIKIYSGAQGFLMEKSHKLLETNNFLFNNKNILDIGSGEVLHKKWMNDVVNYTISESSKVLSKDKIKEYKQKGIKIHFFDKDPDYKDLPQSSFTRIILHHSLEHIPNPELFLKKIINLLSVDGFLNISIPCDPGFFGRLGQILLRKKIYKNFGWNKYEYDLIMSREHINSAHNIKKIINYHFNNTNWKFYPFPFLKIIEFNLIAYLHLNKNQLRKVRYTV